MALSLKREWIHLNGRRKRSIAFVHVCAYVEKCRESELNYYVNSKSRVQVSNTLNKINKNTETQTLTQKQNIYICDTKHNEEASHMRIYSYSFRYTNGFPLYPKTYENAWID